jgi:hypothetical protein
MAHFTNKLCPRANVMTEVAKSGRCTLGRHYFILEKLLAADLISGSVENY